ncbi:MAG: 3-deoxy-D-manno-octulosonic acid transferase [Acidobacteria bacterium]|nr:3-deoxy-D-manno-octulosonic acid transferase [Acidobacteriota bacterium]
MYALYGALLRIAWAAILPYQFVIALLRGGPRLHWKERLGLLPGAASPPAGGIWIHAVSVGEVRLALSLLRPLRQRFAGTPVCLTTGTATGRALAAAAAPGEARPDMIATLPLDLPGPMGRFLDRLRPRAVLIVETEIWPNLLRLCGRRGVPVILVNGRISPRAHARYRMVRRFLQAPLGAVGLFGMQSEEDARRIRDLGARADRVRVTGNLKFDLPVPEVAPAQARRRIGLADGDAVLVAGSTAPGEEPAILQAFRALRDVHASVRLILAPRHPERFDEAESALRQAGLRVARFSRIGGEAAGAAPADVPYEALLLDTLGVLPEIYAAADLVFVGGSLVRRGGQNILEPAALGKPVLFGPHVDNFRAAATALTEAGGGFVARDGEELAGLAVRLLGDPAARRVAGAMARRVVEANRGATSRTIAIIVEALGPRPAAPACGAGRT